MARPKKESQQVPIQDPKSGKLKGSRSTKGQKDKDIPKPSATAKKALPTAKKVVVKKAPGKVVAKKTIAKKVEKPIVKKATATKRTMPKVNVVTLDAEPLKKGNVAPLDTEPLKKGPRLFPSFNKLPDSGLTFDGFLTAVQKLDESTIEKLVDSQTTLAPNKWNYARSVEIAQRAIMDEDSDDADLIEYEEKWLEKYPRLSDGGGGDFNAIYDFRFNMSGELSLDKGYEIAARTHLALLARKEDIDFAESSAYEILTTAWRTHVGRIHRDDEDLLAK